MAGELPGIKSAGSPLCILEIFRRLQAKERTPKARLQHTLLFTRAFLDFLVRSYLQISQLYFDCLSRVQRQSLVLRTRESQANHYSILNLASRL